MAQVKDNPFVRPDPIVYTDDEHNDWDVQDDWLDPFNPMNPLYDSDDSPSMFRDSYNPHDPTSVLYDSHDSLT